MTPALTTAIARRLSELEAPPHRWEQAANMLAQGVVLLTIDRPGCRVFCAWALRPDAPWLPTFAACQSQFNEARQDAELP